MTKEIQNSRQRAGQQGEAYAAAALSELHYTILARNWRTRTGELDIIARDGEWLVFVEVRARRRRHLGRAPFLGTPEESVTRAKQIQLVNMAETYLLDHPWDGPWRIDIVAVEIGPNDELLRLAHLEDAVGGVV